MKKFLFIITIVLLINLVSPTLKAHASLPTSLPGLPTFPTVPITNPDYSAKETGIKIPILGINIGISWDQIAIEIAKRFIEHIVDSTIDWINNGFNGNPSFISNPGGYFKDIADGIAGDFIYGSDVGFLCSPFQDNLRISLAITYANTYGGRREAPSCTLSGVIDNVEDFYNDFSKGGWDSWYQITQNPTYNPYSGYVEANAELNSRIAANLGSARQKLDWGNGFLSRPGDCIDFGDLGNGTDGCREYAPDKTPGVVIESQLENVLGTGIRQLELADEMDELIGALIGQLLSKTVFGGNGLVSSSKYKTSGDNTNIDGGLKDTPRDYPIYTPPPSETPPGEPPPGTIPGSFACAPNPTSVGLGSTVTWSVLDGTGNPSTFVWSGEGVEGKIGVSVTATYNTAGTRSVSVTAVPTDGVTAPESVNCGEVTVGGPTALSASCSPTTFSTNTGEAVGWVATISGGSGNYSLISWDGDESTLGDGSNAWDAYTPQITKNGNTTTVFQLRVYYETGNKSANITVVDSDSAVPSIANQSCSGSIFVN